MKRLWKIICVSAVFAFAIIITVFSERTVGYATDALRVCAISIIPALFPYMVVSSMLVSSNAATLIGRLLPLSRLQCLPDRAAVPMILGALCGFPVGAKAAVDMYKRGELSKEQTEALVGSANNTGPSFVVFVVGASFFNNLKFGWYLYTFQILSSFIAALIVNRIVYPIKYCKEKRAPCKLCTPDIAAAVVQSASSVITVCGFIVFFSVVCGFAMPYITKISPEAAGIFASLTEFTTGSRIASFIGGKRGQFLCGLAVGFSGLSVFCQTAAITSPAGLSLKRCFLIKTIQGVLTGLLATIPGIRTSASAVLFPYLYDEAFLLLSSKSPLIIISFILYGFLVKNIAKKDKI